MIRMQAQVVNTFTQTFEGTITHKVQVQRMESMSNGQQRLKLHDFKVRNPELWKVGETYEIPVELMVKNGAAIFFVPPSQEDQLRKAKAS